MKLMTIIGARPQFIKAAVVSHALKQYRHDINEIIIHTGQHFDSNMSDIFFGQLNIAKPDIQMNINSGRHGEMTGLMLAEIELRLIEEKPDRVLVYGDTNSTLAGALAAAKLHIPVAHVESGLRSFNLKMPEEINRIVTDQVSDLLFCPTATAVSNLKNEGFHKKSVSIKHVGDVMQDAAILFREKAMAPKFSDIPKDFILATVHRAENTDDPVRLANIVNALNELHAKRAPVVLPLHPRTRKLIDKQGLNLKVIVLEPVGYFEMIWLLEHSQLVMTDSGGVQKEAFFFNKACVTMRDQTEWTELVDIGANEIVGANSDLIVSAAERNYSRKVEDNSLYGGGEASRRIAEQL
ncbi:UDP-N-acetylglucosamine 2-epimerase (non-hydrolyzing) [Idiomarina sp.]|uniref:non-hydrolyzing UDP-N-acetylglucosamine 2-epimerase n=1 Tax=Idiomarina sp. TaxID=1874361 RepID=UPI001D79ACD3|nr:UDP-N-acetylglucosamine 2-epimerase (non-hydrolyzing) [Idiomarina sp.]MCJ8316216.1 UDP-N-acetylglucosamine 2-epimerase (non-hydrolyzing) [Idiomarina sp.]NQZ16129.1 UDP-N-acetylglucosamine 2-epimerase (non-hydrolyzing) [Idiomarina sp.]